MRIDVTDEHPADNRSMTGRSTISPAAVPPAEATIAAPPVAPTASPPRNRDVLRAASIAVAVLIVCIAAYLALAVPGAWFPRAAPKSAGVKQLTLVRGTGRVVGNALVVTAPDAAGIALVSVTTDFRSTDYPGIDWSVSGLREDADVRLLWRNDFQPEKLASAPIGVEAGRTITTVLAHDPAWIGHIDGVALAIHGTLPQPIVIRGVTAKPMGAIEILRDRLGEWFAFERWNGASINTIAGGKDYQRLPLPVLLALVVLASGIVVVAIRRFRPHAFRAATPALLAAFFLVGWLLLDARWTWNLLRQERDTAAQYAGKDARDKRLANDDGPLFAFIEKALAVLPSKPVRIFIASDADYLRDRAAYHLYPHRVFFDPRSNALPPATDLHPGDWLLVYEQHGIQFDRAQGKVRWDGGQIVNAELKLVEPGGALFLVR